MQSVRHTVLEVLISTGAAFIISALLQHFVVNPLWHLQSSASDSIGITVLFTVVSLVRSYILRRIFNKLGSSK
jgi:hypothetical protein